MRTEELVMRDEINKKKIKYKLKKKKKYEISYIQKTFNNNYVLDCFSFSIFPCY